MTWSAEKERARSAPPFAPPPGIKFMAMGNIVLLLPLNTIGRITRSNVCMAQINQDQAQDTGILSKPVVVSEILKHGNLYTNVLGCKALVCVGRPGRRGRRLNMTFYNGNFEKTGNIQLKFFHEIYDLS